MSTAKGTDDETRFAREWRAWLDRSVRQSPAVAAARISERLRDVRPQRRRHVWGLATAGATLALLAVICLFPRRISTELPVATQPPAGVSDPAQPGEVLIWLDENTPLYMHFQAPPSEGVNKI